MSYLLRACAAVALMLGACARDGDAAGSAPAASEAGIAGAPADASESSDADMPADAAPPDASGRNDPEPVIGDDYVRYDALWPSPRGVVRLGFDAPDDAVSFVVTLEPEATPRAIQLIEVRGPDGLLWSALEPGPHPFEPLARGNLNDFVPYSVMLPSAPELPLASGRYELALRVGSDDALTVRGDVVFKRAPADPAGALAIAVWFVEGAGIDAEGAASNARLAEGLSAFAEILAAAGVELTQTVFRDLTGQGAAALAGLDDDAETAELLARLAAEDEAASERALHFVFVASIEAGAGKTVRGKTTGLPGPPAHPELARRGAVIIAIDTLPVSARRIGEMLAHEAGHYLGLRHTSEFDGLRHDPLADTPECPAERSSVTSSDGTKLLSAEDCVDLDGANLLFYTPPQRALSQDEISEDQAFVLRRSPLLR
jgi:hypothetical protein